MQAEEFKQRILQVASFETVYDAVKERSASFTGRVKNRPQWGVCLDAMLDAAMQHSLVVDFSQHHMKRQIGGQRVYAWRIILTGDAAAVERGLDILLKAASTAPRIMQQLESFPLTGGGTRNEPGRPTKNGFSRGATGIGSSSGGGGPYRVR